MDEIKTKEAIAGLMKDKNQREALAELLIEFIQPNHIAVDFISLLLNARSLKPGQALVKKVRKGITVHTHVPGAIGLKSEVTVSDRINYILDTALVGVLANEWDLESGELGTVDELKTEAMAKLRDYYMNKVFTALTSVWTAANTPDNYTSMGSSSVTSTALEAAINRINQTTPGVKAIVGTRAALTPITKFGAFWSDGTNTEAVPSQIEAVMRDGWLGHYFGAPIIALQQSYDNPEDYNAQLPSDKILVIGQNAGEFITYGDERYKEWINNEPTPPYWNFDIMSQFGLIVDNAQGIYVIGGIA